MLQLKCEVESSPPAEAFHWTFNSSGEQTELTSQLQTTESGWSRLNYTPTSDLDYGTISCWARNVIGTQKTPCVFQIVAAGGLFNTFLSLPPHPFLCVVKIQICVQFNLISTRISFLYTHNSCMHATHVYVEIKFSTSAASLSISLSHSLTDFHFIFSHFTGRPFALQNCSVSNQSIDTIHVECIEGFDGGLPQMFLLEMVEIPTLKLVRNLTLYVSILWLSLCQWRCSILIYLT